MINIKIDEPQVIEMIENLVAVELNCYEYEGDGEGTYQSQQALADLLSPDLLDAIKNLLDEDDLFEEEALNPKYVKDLLELVKSTHS